MKIEQFIISFFPIVIIFSMLLFIQALRNWGRGRGENSFHVLTIMNGPGLPAVSQKIDSGGEASERRKYPRETLKAFVDFVYKGALVKTVSKDFSWSGMFIDVDGSGRFNINNELTLVFQKHDGTPFKSSARIVRINDDGIGVEFLTTGAGAL